MPAESGPRSLMVTSMSVSIAPSRGSSPASFKNNPTIPHIPNSPRPIHTLRDKASNFTHNLQLPRNFFHRAGKRSALQQFCLTECRTRSFLQENNIAEGKNGAGAASIFGKHKARWEGNVSDLDLRIEAMHKRDVLIAWAFVAGLWLSMIFVAWATWDLAPAGAARVLLMIAGAIVLLFNTAAILAMLKHYREDRAFIYGLDIRFLDEAKARKG